MNKIRNAILLLFITATATFGQELRLIAFKEPLDKVVSRLGVEVSFNSRALSRYKVSVDKSFQSPAHALDFLLQGKPYTYDQIGNVYIILETKKKDNTKLLQAKQQKDLSIQEIPVIKEVNTGEVIITASGIRYSPQPDDNPTETVINHQAARYMPGSGDNSVFNLLKMVPGVRASGEPSEELIVWGSSAGESRVIFDGIPLFGMRGFNDNISFINPYLVSEIRLMKGGYDASYGNQTGAVVEIKGTEPVVYKPSVKATISTLTANIFGSIPVSKRSALSFACRRTFYDLYQSGLLNPYNGHHASGGNQGSMHGSSASIPLLIPKYSFSDLNVNYSGSTTSNDSYRIALYGADDRFNLSSEPTANKAITAKHNSKHAGASAMYNRNWKENVRTNLAFSYSRLNATADQSGMLPVHNLVQQISGKLSQYFLGGKSHHVEIGAELDSYSADSLLLIKPSLYVTDHLKFGQFMMNVGIRGDFVSGALQLQPRIATNYRITDRVTATASWGLYNQYVVRLPFRNGDNNYTSVWGINEDMNAMHSIAGVSYSTQEGFSVHLEGYLKNIRNAIRLVDNGIVNTDVNIYGCDLFLKKDFNRGTVFGSYSVCSIRNMETGHEIKLGGLITLKSFVVSANYVYGTGFSVIDYSGHQGHGYGHNQGKKHSNTTKPYNRLDMAATYRVQLQRFQLRTGLSLINLFDTDNLKYSYTVQSKNNPITLYSDATSFTPMLFFEVIW